MLDTSIVTQPGGPLFNAMGDFKQITSNASGAPDPILALKESASGHRDNPGSYAYYWHGYQVFLRPALMVFTYGDLRYVNLIALAALALAVVLLLHHRVGARAAVAFGLALAACGFFIVPLSLQFSSMTHVMLVATLVVLVMADSDWLGEHVPEFFMLVGMLAAFFDLLTTPLMTLGMPLAVALVLAEKESRDHPVREDLRFLAQACVAWGVGYAGAWVAKWFIGAAVTKTDVVREAVAQLLFRAGASDAKPRFLEAIQLNLADLAPMLRVHSTMSTLVFLGVLALVLTALAVASQAPVAQILRALPVLLVVPLPYLWYAAASNHSAIHNWFTYRGQVFAVFALLYVLACAIDFETLARRLGHSRAES